MAIPKVLVSLGADPAKVLAEIGVNLSLFSDPDNRLSYLTRGRIFAHCLARTGCHHFGLLVGQHADLDSFGLGGLLAKSSPDVHTALRSFIAYFHLHVRGASAKLDVDQDVATLIYEIQQPQSEATDQIGDGAIAIMLNMMRQLCGGGFEPSEACFAHRRPEDIWPFRRFFRATLRFDSTQNALVFPAKWLERRLPDNSRELRRLLQKQADAAETLDRVTFADQVRAILRGAILTGHCNEEEVARLFSMSGRTLNRHLHECGTGFRELVETNSLEIARQLLQNTSLPVREIAGFLGYADPSSFTRAFRRWSGTTPANWRARSRHLP